MLELFDYIDNISGENASIMAFVFLLILIIIRPVKNETEGN